MSGVPSLAVKIRRQDSFRFESLAVLLLLCIATSLLSPYFLTGRNLLNILLATSVIGILAIGMTFVICMAAIDLSVGSTLALSAVIAGTAVSVWEMPWPLGILGALGTGALVGLVNGFLVTRADIPAFIVTLGTLGIARGLAYIITTERAIYGMPDEIVFLGQGRILGIPIPVIIFLVLAASAHVVMRHSRFGRYTLAIGDNLAAAEVTGINVKRHQVKVFVLMGVLAAAAGLVQVGRLNAADPSSGLFYELSAITAAIIGGCDLFGGRGTIPGTLVGALIMGVIQNCLNLLGIEAFYQQVAIGTVLILAVWLDRLRVKLGAA
jgi:ribose/xylose/arabinose/galactoside ABC-type transport system permease subunit